MTESPQSGGPDFTKPAPTVEGAMPPPPPGFLAPQGFAQVPAGLYPDPASGVLIPQGTALAGVGRRIGAWFLSILLAVVTLFIGYVIWGVIAWTKGTTPALQVLGCKVWRPDDGKVAGFGWMLLREVVGRFIDGVLSIITLLVSFVLMVSQPKRQTLHDLISGTVVLHDPDKVLR